MNEEREQQKTAEVVDSPDQPAEGGQFVRESTEENQARTHTGSDELVPLFETGATEKFRSRWLAIQSKFVDDPADSVKQADDLVADVIQGVTKSFADRRDTLEKQWNGGAEASTEDLRIALKQYRSFFDRLLTLES